MTDRKVNTVFIIQLLSAFYICKLHCVTVRWLVFDPETGTYVGSGSDGSEQISAVKLSPDGTKLCVAFHNNHMYMYTVSAESN